MVNSSFAPDGAPAGQPSEAGAKPSVGGIYRIVHSRKGEFIAEVLGWEQDSTGEVMLRVRIPTGPDSGQQRLANVHIRDAEGKKTTPEFSEKLLLKSLIESMERV